MKVAVTTRAILHLTGFIRYLWDTQMKKVKGHT